MHRQHKIVAILFTIAALLVAFAAPAGHKPVCCKGYMYWDILEPVDGKLKWRKVPAPITFREVPIAPSIWNLAEAKSRSLLYMVAKASRPAHGAEVKVRSWDAECWHYGEAEPMRLSWPVQP
jgi:hypothetical protein